VLDSDLLDSLTAKAKNNPMLRQNYNLHESYDEPSQRLLNAMEPGSYLPPHRHLVDAKPESFVGVRGKLALIIFGDDGQIDQILPFGPAEKILGIDMPQAT
jgi:cupin fold WbuC family metalloprotein